jgi:hypothetical protein
MLYSLFIYQSSSGLLIWNKSFEKDMDAGRVELFSSFFSAIQSFVREMISTGSKNLKNIEMGNFLVKITNLPKLELDVVAIADSGDDKILNKVTPKIISVLEAHREIFADWDGNRSRFNVLELEILQAIQNERGLFGSRNQSEENKAIVGEVFDKMSELEKSQRENYEKERMFIYERIKTTTNVLKKMEMYDSLITINEKLADAAELQKSQQLKKKTADELKSTKEKIHYFLSQAKLSINKTVEGQGRKSFKDMDFRDVYLNLYSFSTKLKLIGREDLADEIKNLAQLLIDKPADRLAEIPNLLKKILTFNDDPESYIPRG